MHRAAIGVGIIFAFILLVGFWLMGNYNSLVGSKNQVEKSWAQVETQYQRRLDLIDNLVESVKGSQKQEVAVFGDIAKARTAYNNAGTASDKAAAASQIETSIVAVLPRLQEAYPQLNSNENIKSLMNDLKGTEDTIAKARDTFNTTAANYNGNIQKFPKNIFASLFGFTRVSLFKAESGAERGAKIRF